MGSVEVGKWADLMLWRPAFFGVKPSLILKGGFIAAALMGDANANIPTPQAVHDRRSVKQREAGRHGAKRLSAQDGDRRADLARAPPMRNC